MSLFFAKAKADKLPVKKTKKERQWSTAAGILTTNTKIATSFSLPELHANKVISSAGKKGRQSKTRLVKALVNSGASESILAKAKSDKLPVKKTKK